MIVLCDDWHWHFKQSRKMNRESVLQGNQLKKPYLICGIGSKRLLPQK